MNLNISGYITPNTSYGIVTLNLLKAFVDIGHSCSVFPSSDISRLDFGEFTSYVRDSVASNEDFSPSDISFRVAHQFDMANGIGHGPRVGYTFFEMDRLTKLEVAHLNSLDLLLVPSEWAKEVCINSGVSAYISVCPAGYNPNIFYPIEYMPTECTFISVGKWEHRKQQDQIVDSFSKAFAKNDNVKLIMSMDNPFMDLSEKKNRYKSVLGTKLQMIGRLKSHNDLARLIQQSYCFVAPSLAEGWNLPLLEAMACGKFTIATNYSGHTEFCDKNTTLLLEPTSKIKAVDGMWFRENSKTNCGNWITYNEEQLVNHMRSVYQTYKSGATLNYNAIDKSSSYTWENSAKRCVEKFEEICL
jgi:glycosyltransferase involved in cell wall biosynthesis